MVLKASELHVGDSHEEVVVDNLTRTQIVQYAGASGDFNPLHSDDLFAREVAGYPGVFAHGADVFDFVDFGGFDDIFSGLPDLGADVGGAAPLGIRSVWITRFCTSRSLSTRMTSTRSSSRRTNSTCRRLT